MMCRALLLIAAGLSTTLAAKLAAAPNIQQERGRLLEVSMAMVVPRKWLVYFMENPTKIGRFGGTPIFGNLCICMYPIRTGATNIQSGIIRDHTEKDDAMSMV